MENLFYDNNDNNNNNNQFLQRLLYIQNIQFFKDCQFKQFSFQTYFFVIN